jgi:hypothetical protein
MCVCMCERERERERREGGRGRVIEICACEQLCMRQKERGIKEALP